MSAWGLVVGINDYPAGSGLGRLHGAVADAADFADWALDPGGGGVDAAHLFFWTCPAPAFRTARLSAFMQSPTAWPFLGPQFERPPATAEIMRAVPEIARRAVEAGAERLYVFMAGHGAQTQVQTFTEDPQNCFIAGDFVPDLPALGLVGCDDLRRFLQSAGPPEIVLFFDCCRSQLPLRVPRPAVPFNLLRSSGRFRRLALARAAQAEAVAYEVPIGATPPERGAFSKLLVSGLRQFRNGGRLTVSDLDGYVTAGMRDLVTPLIQVPDFEERPRPPALVLAEGRASGPQPDIHLVFSSVAQGSSIVLRDQDAREVASAEVAGQGLTLTLPVGSYSVEQLPDTVLAVFNHLGPETTHVTV